MPWLRMRVLPSTHCPACPCMGIYPKSCVCQYWIARVAILDPSPEAWNGPSFTSVATAPDTQARPRLTLHWTISTCRIIKKHIADLGQVKIKSPETLISEYPLWAPPNRIPQGRLSRILLLRIDNEAWIRTVISSIVSRKASFVPAWYIWGLSTPQKRSVGNLPTKHA